MPQVRDRLDALGFSLPPPPKPAGAYVPARRSGRLVFTSGQLPMKAGVLPRTGKVGAEIDVDVAYDLARLCALNALAAIDDLVGLDAVTSVVKVLGFVASAPDFYGQPAVVNGASEFLVRVFDGRLADGGGHARSAVGVAALPLNAPVEVEMIVRVE
ncbi:MAG: RidA family protein [Frankiaceae bacterium]|jgi:enamine deaminase RidA (YjgF/YER057c/UK114 family)|nr:RidA family protein [Frankiaceae bacterium]